MDILVIGINHEKVNIETREKLYFNNDKAKLELENLSKCDANKECLLLSTCNRTEIYLLSSNIDESISIVYEIFKKYTSESSLLNNIYVYKNRMAVQHLFRVSASLDSMVVGEPQILGQVKEAYKLAIDANTSGPILNRLLHKAFSVAKLIRTETEIASEPVSISSIAFDLAKKIFKSFENKKILLLGSGEMGRITASLFKKAGVQKLYITSRNFEHADKLAKNINGEAIVFESKTDYLKEVDIILCQTGAPEYVLWKKDIENVFKQKNIEHTLFLIDISVPRNLDPEINNIDNVYLFNIDDLNAISKENLKARKSDLEKAQNIINEEVIKFSNWIDSLNLSPIITQLINRFEEIKKTEIENEYKNNHSEERKKIEKIANRMINKILHLPLTSLKTKIDAKNEYIYVLALKKLFHLEGADVEDKDRIKEE